VLVADQTGVAVGAAEFRGKEEGESQCNLRAKGGGPSKKK